VQIVKLTNELDGDGWIVKRVDCILERDEALPTYEGFYLERIKRHWTDETNPKVVAFLLFKECIH